MCSLMEALNFINLFTSVTFRDVLQKSIMMTLFVTRTTPQAWQTSPTTDTYPLPLIKWT
jgi:hypothetical protein